MVRFCKEKAPPCDGASFVVLRNFLTLSLALEVQFFCSQQLCSRQALLPSRPCPFLHERSNRFVAFGLLEG